jgi:hypothetical protein
MTAATVVKHPVATTGVKQDLGVAAIPLMAAFKTPLEEPLLVLGSHTTLTQEAWVALIPNQVPQDLHHWKLVH